jgi:hypothetical protein
MTKLYISEEKAEKFFNGDIEFIREHCPICGKLVEFYAEGKEAGFELSKEEEEEMDEVGYPTVAYCSNCAHRVIVGFTLS